LRIGSDSKEQNSGAKIILKEERNLSMNLVFILILLGLASGQIENSSFEVFPLVWDIYSNNTLSILCDSTGPVLPYDGTKYICFMDSNPLGVVEEVRLQQSFIIPKGTLTLTYHVICENTDVTIEGDSLQVVLDTTTLETIFTCPNNLNPLSGEAEWNLFEDTISQWADGQQHQLSFIYKSFGKATTANFTVDAVELISESSSSNSVAPSSNDDSSTILIAILSVLASVAFVLFMIYVLVIQFKPRMLSAAEIDDHLVGGPPTLFLPRESKDVVDLRELDVDKA